MHQLVALSKCLNGRDVFLGYMEFANSSIEHCGSTKRVRDVTVLEIVL